MNEHNPSRMEDPKPTTDPSQGDPQASSASGAEKAEGYSAAAEAESATHDPAVPESKATPTEPASEPPARPLNERPAEAQPPESAPGREILEPPSADSPPTPPNKSEIKAANEAVLADSRRHTRRAFVAAAAGVAAGYGFYRWLDQSPGIGMQPGPFRYAFQMNAAIARALFRDHALAPTYPLKDARDLRVNGVYGLKRMLVPESWRLQVVGVQNETAHPRFTSDVTAWEYRYTDTASHETQGHDTKVDPNARTAEKMAPKPMLDQAITEEDRAARMPRGKEEAGESYSTLMPQTPGLLLTLDDILQLPRHELVTQFKCIEGWSEIVHWAGVRMAEFMEAYPPALIGGNAPKYVYMETPDGDYYTGYDLDACRHPQTLLVTEMMGAPLTQYHGAPLRLHMPIKYGYKQIKRIGLIAYTNKKPDDYWTKLGYDWFAGL